MIRLAVVCLVGAAVALASGQTASTIYTATMLVMVAGLSILAEARR